MKERLYQKCLRCPWLWGCGLWWCSQWWCWLWGCSTETPADPLDSPGGIRHTTAADCLLFCPPFPPLSSVQLLTVCFVCLSLALYVLYLSASSTFPSIPPPTSTLPHSPRGASQQPGMTSPVTFCPIVPPLLPLPPPPSFLPSHPLLSHSRCHRYMDSAPSRTSACWPGPACWGGWTPLLWGHSCWSGRSPEPGGIESSGPPSRRGTLREKQTQHNPQRSQWGTA